MRYPPGIPLYVPTPGPSQRPNSDLKPACSSQGLPGGSDGKEAACSAGDLDSISGSGRSLEKGMVTHSVILAWRIPRTEEPGGLQARGPQRVRHD